MNRLARALWITGLATLGLLVVLGAVDARLRDTGGPGVLPFEFEFTSENARDTLARWGDDGRSDAQLSLALDFAFLVAYGAFLSLAATALCDALGWQRWAFMAMLPLAAAVCDAIENVALLLAIGQDGDQPWPLLGGAFASAKFALLIPALLFVLGGFVAWLVRGRRRR